MAALMFTDIVGYSSLSSTDEKLAFELLEEHRVILRGLLPRYGGIENKTIGDAFMGASGLLELSECPVACCVELGLQMIRFTQQLCDAKQIPLGFNLRVGVNFGPVVGGMLGRRQALYDLWGDTVNTAARLESHGHPGCVNLSDLAWREVAHLYQGEARSECHLKGKSAPLEVIHLNPASVTRRR